MKRQQRARALCALCLAVFASGIGGASPRGGPEGEALNVVLFLIDDLGWKDLGCYGSTFYETPHIDALARDGMLFTDAYSAAPVCSPSRATLLTGKYTPRTRFTGHITAIGRHRHPEGSRILPPRDRMFLAHEEVTLAEALGASGYVSASIGKWHLGGEEYWPRAHGFAVNVAGWTHGSPPSHFYPYRNPQSEWNAAIPTLEGGKPGEYLTDRLTDEAVHFIDENRERPFFLYLTHYAVHTPIEAPGDLVEKYTEKLGRDTSQKDAAYAGMIESVDRGVGRVLARLRELGLQERTLVIFTSDNGGLGQVTRNAPLRAGKGFLYEGGIRVPLIVRWPGRVAPGSVSREPVTGADLYPTVLEAAGVPLPVGHEVDGRSLVPLLQTRGRPQRRALYWYYPHYAPQAKQPGAAIRAGNYKLIEHYDPPRVELYNLAEDIGERVDLAAVLPAKRQELHGELKHWLASVEGAILHEPNPDHTPRPPETSPNIVFIVTDDQAPWALGAAGNPDARTPHLDRLAREGARLSSAFVTTPVCSPSRAGLLTGRYSTEVGIIDYISRRDRGFAMGLDSKWPTWPQQLSGAGYATALVGKWHLGAADEHHPTKFGYGEFTGFRHGGRTSRDPEVEIDGRKRKVAGFTPDVLTDFAIDFVRRSRSSPFLVALHFWAPHANAGTNAAGDRTWLPLSAADLAALEGVDLTIPGADLPKLDVPRVRRMMREYLSSVAAVDRNLGRLLAELDTLGLRENTVVIHTSDHGYNMGHNGIWHKGNGRWILTDNRGSRPNLFDNSLRVPTLLRWPGVIVPGTVIDETVTNLDWYRTILEMAGLGVAARGETRGRSFLPLLRGKEVPGWNNDLFAQYSMRHDTHADLRAYRTPGWKLIRDFLRQDADELYDLSADPQERRNLIASPHRSVQAQRTKLAARLLEAMREIGDPLLEGKR